MFCYFGLFFLQFYLCNNPKDQNFEKLKKRLGDIIISHMCTINDNQMIMVPKILRVTDFFILDHFLPFYPLTTQNIKLLEKLKKHLEILSFYIHVPKIRTICYTVPEIQHMTDVITFYFELFLPFYPPKNQKNENLKNMKKIPGDIIILHKCTKNQDHMLHCS